MLVKPEIKTVNEILEEESIKREEELRNMYYSLLHEVNEKLSQCVRSKQQGVDIKLNGFTPDHHDLVVAVEEELISKGYFPKLRRNDDGVFLLIML